MPGLLVDRLVGGREGGVGEGARGDGDHVGLALRLPPDRSAAMGAEVEDDVEAGVRRTDVAPVFAARPHLVAGVEGRNAEGPAGAPLACESG